MQAGDLKDRITIQRRTETKNAGGGLDISWTPVASVWAKVVSLNGRESVIGNVLQGTSLFDITIRFRADLEAGDQIVWSARQVRDPVTGSYSPLELNIITAEDRIGTRQWTVVQASTAAPQGA